MLGRLSRNPEISGQHRCQLSSTSFFSPPNELFHIFIPSGGRRVCRAVRPVRVDNGVLVVEELGPVGLFGAFFQHTTLARSSPQTGGQAWSNLINRLLRQPYGLALWAES